ncbi:envoplakin [Pimephales promelas]|uniref:envoplakin n=1 Tax=Pimephales promelas TaxID=90988 RepID=UPI0019557107|nr:envoplakin [Pimephales promelas]KAG1928651.1 periplakin [Pimephales promelas]KAG1928652.1 periplakin [Pimephales promelas]
MFKKKEYSPVKAGQSQMNELLTLVTRLQQSADQVEKNVLLTEELLVEDVENKRKGSPLKHQGRAAENLCQAEILLKDLFMDVSKAKKQQHPQASVIELDVSNLHERWSKHCGTYRELYGQLHEIYLPPGVDWIKLLSDKQVSIQGHAYGPTLFDVEKQIAGHNILHKQIEAYRAALESSNKNSSALQKQYTNLLEASEKRRQHLSSLYDLMQGCSKELLYLKGQQQKISSRDWSDRMIDSAGVRMDYERFKNNGLLSHEKEVRKLQEEARALVQDKHPGATAVQSYTSDVSREWQRFLNLCLCQDTHLDKVEEYKKYQLDLETFTESLKRIKSTTEPSELKNMSNHEILIQLESEEMSVLRNEQRLSNLRDLCSSIAPLHLRRTANTNTSAVALCDWSTDKHSVKRGEKVTLVSSPREELWQVQSSSGETKLIPGVCFLIPPPDSDAIHKVDSLSQDFSDLKRTRSALLAQARTPVEFVQFVKQVPVATVPDSAKAGIIDSRLDQIYSDLLKLERDLQKRIRSPLDRTSPIGDLSARIRDQESFAVTLKNMEAEISSAQRDIQPLISQKPLGPTTSSLPVKLSKVNNKIEDITALSDLFTKKAGSSMFLEKQLKKVNGVLTVFEDQLAEDNGLLNEPNAIRIHSRELQKMSKEVSSKKEDIQQLNHELEVTEQVCSSLQKSFQEFCPDIRHQETEVKRLRNRYSNINSQLQQRATLLQEALNKNQEFHSAVQSLSAFLINIPNNKVLPGESVSQVYAKQSSQMRAIEDIKRKQDDVNRIVKLSGDLQSLLHEYEINSNKYRSALGKPEINSKGRDYLTLAEAVEKKERDVVNLYSEVSAQNNQLLNQVILAKDLINKNEEIVSHVVVKQQLQFQSQQRSMDEFDGLKQELTEEISRRTYAENDLASYRKRMMSLKSRRGVERVEEKETVHYYRDPKLEADLEMLKRRITEEIHKRSEMHTQIEIVNKKIVSREHEVIEVKPRLVTKVFTEIERDPKLDVEMARIRELILKLREEIRVHESETVHMRTEVTVLESKMPVIKERKILKEVVKLEKDPEMLKSVINLKNEISDEGIRCKNLNDEIFHFRSQINNLERIIPTIQPKVIIKELKRVEQDTELLKESNTLRVSLEELIRENTILMKEFSSLQLRFSQVETIRQKVEFNEIIHEIYRIDPETEVELRRLRNELLEISRRRTSLESEVNVIMVDLRTLRAEKPKIEVKEVTREVVKEERSPEVVKELKRLNEQLTILRTNYDTIMIRVTRLRKDRDEWKTERSKVETKVVTKEFIRYENDPLLEKEAERLRREVRDELQRRRTVEENVFDLQNKYIVMERQKAEERVVVQEIVRLQTDPSQILAHERLVKTLEETVKTRRQLELEVQQLRSLVLELEKKMELVDRQKKILIETELRQIKARIYELETCPTPVEEKIVIEEVLKVERDPIIDKRITDLRTHMDNEGSSISRLERDVRNLKIRIESLTKEKSVERIIHKEIIRVEKDPAVEAERESLRAQVAQVKNARTLRDEEHLRLKNKITRIQTTRTNFSQEEVTLIAHRDKIKKEQYELIQELRRLESQKQDITITFQQQTKILSEKNQVSRQKSIKLESDVQRLEREIREVKELINLRESTIIEIQKEIKASQLSETNTRETNVSTKITILDPETGKDMSPYDAYVEGLIDRNQYIHLQELECSWEEITTTGPEGETMLLQDRKSGKQYSVKAAMENGRLTPYDLQRYRESKMSISEFALLVAGEKKSISFPATQTQIKTNQTLPPPSPSYNSSTLTRRFSSSTSSLNSLSQLNTSGDELYPISGILDLTTESRMSVRSALTRKLIDQDTAMRLLEAQAATGGIVDLNKKDKLSIHKAAERGLIEPSYLSKLLSAQKAFTGFEDPVSKERMSVGEAGRRGWIPNDNAMWFMEAQLLTGGLVDPKRAGRVALQNAVDANLIDASMVKQLLEDSAFVKNVIDPIKKEKITYKEAMARCKRDHSTGLLLLPAASNDAVDAPSYSSYKFSK